MFVLHTYSMLSAAVGFQVRYVMKDYTHQAVRRYRYGDMMLFIYDTIRWVGIWNHKNGPSKYKPPAKDTQLTQFLLMS